MAVKKKDFQLEIRLGLTLIVLVLLSLNFASHYTLYRLKQSVELQSKDNLYEAVLKAANVLQREKREASVARAFDKIKLDYSLDLLTVLNFDLKEIRNPEDHQRLEDELKCIDSGLTIEGLLPLLINQPVFHHVSGAMNSLVLIPSGSGNSEKIIVASAPSPLLSTIENAGRILLYVGILGIVVIIYATLKFSRYILMPFKSLKEKAVKSGHFDQSKGDDVSGLISTYGEIIADLRQKEKELKRLNEIVTKRAENLEVYNNYVLKSISTGVITLDNDRNISTINRSAARIFMLEDEDLSGKNYRDELGCFPELLAQIQLFFEHGEAISNQQVSISNENGAKSLLSVSVSTLHDSRGDVIGTWIILNDQTEFIRMREELDLKSRMATLGEMSGGLAHQLRNSIGAIVGFAKLIRKKSRGNPAIRQNLDYLLGESLEAESLVARFLDFARPLEITPESFDPVELLENIISGMNEKYSHVKIRIDTVMSPDISIKGDILLLKQAVGNIVDNACHAVSENAGEVRISAAIKDNNLEIVIADNGYGIPKEYREKIFTPFFSGSPSVTGLGLPLARKIINLHEGSLTFESSQAGTTFRILLPLASSGVSRTVFQSGESLVS